MPDIIPHDAFFKTSMRDPKIARDFLSRTLPKYLLAQIDLNSTQIINTSFQRPDLAPRDSDVIFSVNMNGKKAYIYLMVEHQSTVSCLITFRILEYMTLLASWHLKTHNTEELPFIYPILFYNGKEKYTGPLDLFTLFGPNEQLARDAYSKPLQLVNTRELSDDEIKRWEEALLMMAVMKHIHDPKIKEFFDAFFENIASHFGRERTEWMRQFWTYLTAGFGDGEAQDVLEFARRLPNTARENVMTILEKLQELKKPEWFQQGGEQKSHEIAYKMLLKGKDRSEICELTGLSLSELEKLERTRH